MTKIGIENRSSFQMVEEAVTEALDDADLNIANVDAIIGSSMDLGTNAERQKHSATMMSTLFKKKIPIIRVPAGCAGGSQALWTALKLKYENIIAVGFERLVSNTTNRVTDEILMGGERIYEQSEGLIFPAQNALVAQLYMDKYGATEEDLNLVSLKNHYNAFRNPKARFFNKKVTIEQIKGSPIVASPLRLFDCSMNANGAAACVISKEKTDIEVIGSSLYTDYLSPMERDDMLTWDATLMSSKDAYNQAGISPDEIDFVEIHDAFTPVELISYEDLGFCKKGEGKNMIRDGITKIDGKLPVNTCGGLKAKGHPISATGIAQVYEIFKQMRNEAVDRQLTKNKLALAQNIGGVGSTVSVHIFKKVGG